MNTVEEITPELRHELRCIDARAMPASSDGEISPMP